MSIATILALVILLALAIVATLAWRTLALVITTMALTGCSQLDRVPDPIDQAIADLIAR
jgi:hypothetical protein